MDESVFEESMSSPFFKTIQVPELGIYSVTIQIQTLVQFIGRKVFLKFKLMYRLDKIVIIQAEKIDLALNIIGKE